ncbi:MAG: hypothetical protein FJW63_08405 [Actinobacteria bacterium]|nr:hypothetical protein [Actinomycetota bacterium]
MFFYKAYGLNISSEIELPGMIDGSRNDKSDVKITFGKLNSKIMRAIEGPNYRVDNEDVYLWWDDVGKVKITSGNQITVDPVAQLENSDETNIIPFLLGPVMALLLHQRGFLVLHGSSVKVNDGAVAFLGYRGIGKSTTAINLYKKGYPLVTDDILAINFDDDELPTVYPGYPHVRLSEDSYAHVKDNTDILTPIRTIVGKVFCDASWGFTPESIRLKRIYILEESNQTRISVYRSQENLIDLIRHSIANRIFQHTTQKENLVHCAQLINSASVRRLEISHSFGKIHELVTVVEEDFNMKL